MTVPTRRRLFVCLFVLTLTVPLEVILLKAMSTPDTQQAVKDWVAGLSPAELDAAAGKVQSYPFVYRREIMRALPPAQRSEVWRDHIRTYLASHPDLASDVTQVLEAAIELASPETFAGGTNDAGRQATAIAEQLIGLIGRPETDYLLYRLGPRDEQTSSIEPVLMRFTNYVRSLMVAFAAEGGACDCASSWGCDGAAAYCRTDGVDCEPDTEWPMCGWLWNDVCDGECRTMSLN